ncbi:MAG: hypothetical protein U0P45_07615 [Acidimicrobiales bacterium]
MADQDETDFDTQKAMTDIGASRSAAAGDVLTCTNPDCGCELEVVRPCPHAEVEYSCACGHSLRRMGA